MPSPRSTAQFSSRSAIQSFRIKAPHEKANSCHVFFARNVVTPDTIRRSLIFAVRSYKRVRCKGTNSSATSMSSVAVASAGLSTNAQGADNRDFQILRIRNGLLAPNREIRLDELTTDINFRRGKSSGFPKSIVAAEGGSRVHRNRRPEVPQPSSISRLSALSSRSQDRDAIVRLFSLPPSR